MLSKCELILCVQYQNILELLTSFDQIAVAFKYQKYKPSSMNKKLRWKFAYKCVLEEDVKRRRNMWSWAEIQRHRTMLKEYKAVYKRKLQLQGGKIPGDLSKQLEVRFKVEVSRV
jgi:vacuolar protein sorting-associated protein 13A/C